jgi:hypothetical protein
MEETYELVVEIVGRRCECGDDEKKEKRVTIMLEDGPTMSIKMAGPWKVKSMRLAEKDSNKKKNDIVCTECW